MDKKDKCRDRQYATTRKLVNIGCETAIGTRNYQQDRVTASDTELWKYAAVCDGMGGMEQGDMASEHCIKKISEFFHINNMPDDMESYFVNIATLLDIDVSKMENAQGDRIETGTTLVAATVCEKKLFWLSVGDSRIYLVSDNKIVQLTRDQNYQLELEQMVTAGLITAQQAQENVNKNALISYIGINGLEYIDYGLGINVHERDKVILCSDGLYNLLEDNEINAVCNNGSCDAMEISRRLVAMAQEKNNLSKDNMSVAVIIV